MTLKVFLDGEEITPRVFSLDEPPAFGQVWEWGGATMLLIRRGNRAGVWQVMFLDSRYDQEPIEMHGLHDQASDRISGYRRLA